MDRKSKSFHPFARLPYELQDAIWEASLPCRLVNHNRPVPLSWSTLVAYKRALDFARPLWPTPAPWLVDGAPVARARGDRAIPVVAHVCRRARAVTLLHGVWVRTRDGGPPAWFDRRRDTVLIEDAIGMDVLMLGGGLPGPDPPELPPGLLATAAAASGRLAVAYALLRDARRRRDLLRMLAAGGFGPLIVYTDEIVLRGSRSAVMAAAATGLFYEHAPAAAVAGSGSGSGSGFGFGSGAAAAAAIPVPAASAPVTPTRRIFTPSTATSGLYPPVRDPVAAAAAGPSSAAGPRRRDIRCWRLVPLEDAATLQRMLAFCEQLARGGGGGGARKRRRRQQLRAPSDTDDVHAASAFFRQLLRPEHLCVTASRISNRCLPDVAPADGSPPVVPLEKVPSFQPAVLVWFLVDK